ncbi:SDR family NAD(P)-dependent oxidoreductase, partial [Limnoraphis robusta]
MDVLPETLQHLKEQVAIITGASRGIGRAIAIALASEGANIVVNYASSSGAADELVSEIT